MRALVAVGIVGWNAAASAADAPPSQADITQVVGVHGNTCTLHSDGAVSCWGGNAQRQLGTADATPRPTPVDVPVLRGAVQLGGVGYGICGRFNDGRLTCLGLTPNAPASGVKQPLTDVVEVRGDCVRMKSGKVACFALKTMTWSEIAGVTDAIAVDGALDGGCVVHADASVSCWGHDFQGKGTLGANDDGSVKRIAGVTGAVELAVGLFQACARDARGRVSCWGVNVDGQLGRGSIDKESTYEYNAPAKVIGLADATRIHASASTTCAIRKTGALVCWGKWHWRQGDGVKDMFSRPTPVPGVRNVRDFMATDHACAVGKGRELWCWGDGRYGQLGLGYAERLDAARDVPAITDAVGVHATTLGTCVVRKNGALRCFGEDGPAPKGAPPLTRVSSFHSKLTGLDRAGKLWFSGDPAARSITGVSHAGACVVTKQGTVTCRAGIMYTRARTGTVAGVSDAVEVTGENDICIRHKTGRISCLTINDALGGREAKPVPTIDDAIAVSTSHRESCAVRADRSVWCWGRGDSQFLGGPADVPSSTTLPDVAPFQIRGVKDVAQLDLGEDHDTSETACAVTTSGRVTCWGVPNETYRGVLDATGAVEIPGITDATQVSVGWLHACAVRKTGAVACWGSTGGGQSGTLPTGNVATPQLVRWPTRP